MVQVSTQAACDMSCASGRRQLVVTGLIFVCGLVYGSVLWSGLPTLLPSPINEYGFLFEKLVGDWWRNTVHLPGPPSRSHYVLWAAGRVVTGFVLPIAALVMARRRLTDMGLGWPNRLGRRFILAGIVLSIPFGLWVLAADSHSMTDVWNDFRYVGVCGGIVMIPEHFFICGLFVALLLPERKLPEVVPVPPVKGPMFRHGLAWLGFGPSTADNVRHPVLSWFGLTPACLFAILASGLLFMFTHIGEPGLELALSLPGGTAIAYITLRSHSIWPGLLAHYALNLIPLGLWLMFR
jgi:membrane protease YdiL (CAAX protease family)